MRRSKRKTTAVVVNIRKYCRIENDNKIFNKKVEGTAIHSEELKQPTRFNFENPNVSEEDCEYEYCDPVGWNMCYWNIPQSQTSSSLKCDTVDGNTFSCISQTSISPQNVFKVKEECSDEIIDIHAAAVTLSNREAICFDDIKTVLSHTHRMNLYPGE